MSYCYIHGIAPVSEGRRVQSTRANGQVVWHAVYDTVFQTETDTMIDGIFRTFAPASESNLPSDTLILVHGKFSMPSNPNKDQPSEFIIESISHKPFVANPEEEGFDSFLPIDTVPVLSLLGNVIGSVVQMGDGARAIDVRVSSYIQNKTVDSIYRYLCAY